MESLTYSTSAFRLFLKTPPQRGYMQIDWLRWSLLSQGILFAYYQLIEWVNLFPWNDIRNGNGQATVEIIVSVIMAVLILITTRKMRWLMGIPLVLYGYWIWLQIQSWWLPYLHGASAGWKRVYGRFFSSFSR